METFIVRVWTPSPELAHEIAAWELHGSIEHVRSKESTRFHSGDDLLEILRLASVTTKHPLEDPPGPP